jgi:hypothetical protein
MPVKPMNESRVLVGGLIAGGVLLAGTLGLGRIIASYIVMANFAYVSPGNVPVSRLVWFVAGHFVIGLGLVWLYAAMRPRFGAGPMTAVRAGVAAWLIAIAVPAWFQLLLGTARPAIAGGTMLSMTVVSGVLFTFATLAGAWAYRESPARESAPARKRHTQPFHA